MKEALLELLRSKKFLVTMLAVLTNILGRWGLDVSQETLDRITAALLVLVGAQGLTDFGKASSYMAERGQRAQDEGETARLLARAARAADEAVAQALADSQPKPSTVIEGRPRAG